MRVKLGLVTIMLLAGLVACGTPVASGPVGTPTASPTPVCRMADGRLAYDVLRRAGLDYADAADLASRTARIALAGPVQQVQALRRDTETTDWPLCAQDAANLLLASENEAIQSLLAFMSQDQAQSDLYATESSTDADKFRAALDLIPH